MNIFEYKVAIYSGNPEGPQFPGNTKVDPDNFTEFLNQEGAEGWEVVSVKQRAIPSIFQHEDYVIVMKRLKNENLERSSKNKKK